MLRSRTLGHTNYGTGLSAAAIDTSRGLDNRRFRVRLGGRRNPPTSRWKLQLILSVLAVLGIWLCSSFGTITLRTELLPRSHTSHTMHARTVDAVESGSRGRSNITAAPTLRLQVGRSVLAKLEQLEDAGDDDDLPYSYRLSTDPQVRRWPPMVTGIPDNDDATAQRQYDPRAGLATEEVDLRFCKTSPCRFLLPLAIAEKEPRLQTHLAQLLSLSSSLNRTLVLPNVNRGRAGACARWDFSVYFDIASLVKAGGTSVMLMDDFRTWVDVRPTGPTAQFVSVDAEESELLLDGSPVLHHAGFYVGGGVRVDLDDALDLDDVLLRSARCLGAKFRNVDLDTYSPLSAHLALESPDSPHEAAYAHLAKALRLADTQAHSPHAHPEVLFGSLSILDEPTMDSQGLATSQGAPPDILLLGWDMQVPSFRAPPVKYSAKLWTLAQELTASLGPFVAVHWRMEKVSPSALAGCAEGLVDELDLLLRDDSLSVGTRVVWLTTDYPYSVTEQSDEGPQPDTWGRLRPLKQLMREHKEAMDIVRAAFRADGELSSWRLTGLAEELRRTGLIAADQTFTFDLGGGDDASALLGDFDLLDIMDRLVTMKAALFVTSAKSCGRISTSTKQVVDFRARSTDDNRLNNVVNLFG